MGGSWAAGASCTLGETTPADVGCLGEIASDLPCDIHGGVTIEHDVAEIWSLLYSSLHDRL